MMDTTTTTPAPFNLETIGHLPHSRRAVYRNDYGVHMMRDNEIIWIPDNVFEEWDWLKPYDRVTLATYYGLEVSVLEEMSADENPVVRAELVDAIASYWGVENCI